MLGPFTTASRLTPIHQVSPAPSGTPLCIVVHDANDDNAWQRGLLWPHGMGPITWQFITLTWCCYNTVLGNPMEASEKKYKLIYAVVSIKHWFVAARYWPYYILRYTLHVCHAVKTEIITAGNCLMCMDDVHRTMRRMWVCLIASSQDKLQLTLQPMAAYLVPVPTKYSM